MDLERVRPILPQLIDALSDAILVVDKSRRVVAANRRYEDAFGQDGGLRAGSACTQGRCPEIETGIGSDRCATCDAIALKRVERRLRVLPDAAGAQRRWEGTFSPVVDSQGEVTHVVEVWRDVSERGQLEIQLSHSERLAALGVLAAGVAHEINNPLAAILVGVESLQRRCDSARLPVAGYPDEESAYRETHELLETLDRETRRCRDITEKLMLLAQPYSESAVWVDVNRAAQDTLQLLRYQMQRQGVLPVEDLEVGTPRIWARESGIRGVCMNLMMNAVQAMPQGGTLTVRTRRVGQNAVKVEVSDTGPGIAPQHFDRIWDPFFTTKPTGQGTGLGLSITQRIVARHGGVVRAENIRGGGARFTVEVPIEGPGGAALG
jgi:hypothetical protein